MLDWEVRVIANTPGPGERPPRATPDPGLRPLQWVFALGGIVALVAWLMQGVPVAGPRVEGIDDDTIARGDRYDAMDAAHPNVTFADLSGFDYNEAGAREGAASLIPSPLRQLDGQKVSIDGFMMPLDYDGGGVNLFILNASYDMCGFGAPSRINQRIDVTVADGKRTAYTHMPMRVFGTLHVSEQWARGRLQNIYRMTADAIALPGARDMQ